MDTESSVRDRVVRVTMEALNLTGEPPSLDAGLREELATTSLEQLTLFMALEDEFNDSIPQEDTERITTLGEVVTYIENKLSADR